MHFYSLCSHSAKPTAIRTNTFCTFVNFQPKEVVTILFFFNKRHYWRESHLNLLPWGPAGGLRLFLLCGRAALNFNAIKAWFTTWVCWLFRPRRFSSILLTASYGQSILAPHRTSGAKFHRTVTSKISSSPRLSITFHWQRGWWFFCSFALQAGFSPCRFGKRRYFMRIGIPTPFVTFKRLWTRPQFAPIPRRLRAVASHYLGCAKPLFWRAPVICLAVTWPLGVRTRARRFVIFLLFFFFLSSPLFCHRRIKRWLWLFEGFLGGGLSLFCSSVRRCISV